MNSLFIDHRPSLWFYRMARRFCSWSFIAGTLFLAGLLFLATAPASMAQTGTDAFAGREEINEIIVQRFRLTLNELEQSLSSSTDPYGIHTGIRVVLEEAGQARPYEHVPTGRLQAEVQGLIGRQRLDRFHMDESPEMVSGNGFFIYTAGLTGLTLAPDPREFETVATEYSRAVSVNGVFQRLLVHTHAFGLVSKPDDGSILSTLKYHAKDGGMATWDHRTWKNNDPHVAYVRVGPGNDNTNSRKGEDHFERTSVSEITISNHFNPGHYLPIIQFRGCEQDFTDPGRFGDMEAIVQTEERVSWADFKEFADGTVVPLTRLKASSVRAPDFLSWFSTGNTVRGFIRDETGNPIQGKVIVVLEPMFRPGPEKKEIESLPGGMYAFEEVESGIYKVYVEGQQNNFTRVEVCNCPQNFEGPNHTYEADIRLATTYDIYVSCSAPGIGSYEVVWRNVRIAFMDNEEDIPFIDAEFFETGETGFDDDIEGLNGRSDDGPLIMEIDPGPEYVSQRLTPPYRLYLPGYGIETYYSDEESNIPEAIRINMDGFNRIRPGESAVNHFYIQRTWEFPQLHVEFSIDLMHPEGFQILTGAGPADGGMALGFKWERLDDDILERLKRGEAATKNLTNFYGNRMTVRFSPNR